MRVNERALRALFLDAHIRRNSRLTHIRSGNASLLLVPLMAQGFSSVPFPDKSGSWSIRYYQQNAVENALEAIAAGRKRILLTLATGTGKTSIAFQIAWRLFQTRWNLSGEPTRRPRILFPADRNNLANQAYNDFTSFAAFEEKAMIRIRPDEIAKKGSVPKNASIFFTIFQTFMSGTGPDGQPAPY